MLNLAASPKQITGTVVGTKHAGTSSMGNPSYDVTILLTAIDGTPVTGTEDLRTVIVRTVSNSSIAYSITGAEYRDQPHTFDLSHTGRLHNAKVAA